LLIGSKSFSHAQANESSLRETSPYWFLAPSEVGLIMMGECKIKILTGFEGYEKSGCAHLFRPMYPDFLHCAPPTAAHAAFIKESRMRVVDASQLDRKSGVRPTARRGR
jgi:hypothetical protein